MKRWLAILAPTAVLAVAAPCHGLDEHDAAKAAVAARASLPLEAIVERVVGADTEILDAHIERTSSTYRYRLKLLEGGHTVRILIVDDRTGAVLSGNGRHAAPDR